MLLQCQGFTLRRLIDQKIPDCTPILPGLLGSTQNEAANSSHLDSTKGSVIPPLEEGLLSPQHVDRHEYIRQEPSEVGNLNNRSSMGSSVVRIPHTQGMLVSSAHTTMDPALNSSIIFIISSMKFEIALMLPPTKFLTKG